MASKKAPLSGRELIRYLPDLLTGKEPVFEDPAVQRFITQDPEGRAAVGLIADTAAALTVAHDRVATQTYAAIKPLRESVLAAKKYAKRQLADLLFYEGWRRLREGLKATGTLLLSDVADPPTALNNIESDPVRLFDQIGLPGAVISHIQGLLNSHKDISTSNLLKSASRLFETDRTLIPGRDGSTVLHEIASESAGRSRTPRQWESFAESLTAPLARAAALDRACMRYCAEGSLSRATAKSWDVVGFAPNELVYLAHCYLIGVVGQDDRLARLCADRVCSQAEARPDDWIVALPYFRSDFEQLTATVSKHDRARIRSRISAMTTPLSLLCEGPAP